jgi:hypothetical protein
MTAIGLKLVRYGILLLTTITAVLVLFTGTAIAESRVLGPTIELPTIAENCIRPSDVMRREHMILLKHKRDETVRNGIRTKDASLQGCVDCHSKKDTNDAFIPVDDPGQFCSTCHEYTAVKLDCFECHRTTPDIPDVKASLPGTAIYGDLFANNTTHIDNLQYYLKETQ